MSDETVSPTTESDAEPTGGNQPVADDRSTPEQSDDTGAATESAPGGNDIDPQDQRLSDEAARWRRQARAAETRETVLAARVAEMQKAEINRAVEKKLAVPDDFWLWPGVNFDDFIVDGEIDLDAVAAKADEIRTARPLWAAKLAPVGAPSAAVQGDGRYNVPGAAQPTWEGLLKGKTAG